MTKRKKYYTDSTHGIMKRHVQKSPEERLRYVERIKQKQTERKKNYYKKKNNLS